MGTPNWGKLYQQGRCKAIGVPWSEEELHAIFHLGIPVEYVRSGILSEKDYKDAKTQDEKEGTPPERMTREQLETRAEELGIEITPQTPDAALLQTITIAEKKKASKSKKKAEKPKEKPRVTKPKTKDEPKK